MTICIQKHGCVRLLIAFKILVLYMKENIRLAVKLKKTKKCQKKS